MNEIKATTVLNRFLIEKQKYRELQKNLSAYKEKMQSPESVLFDEIFVEHHSEWSHEERYAAELYEREKELHEASERLRSVLRATQVIIYSVKDKTARTGLIMHYLKAQTWKEAAEELEVTVPALKMRVQRNAMPEIRKTIQGMEILLHGNDKSAGEAGEEEGSQT